MIAPVRTRTVGLAGLVALLFALLGSLAQAGVGPGGYPLSGDDWTTSPRVAAPSSGPGFVLEVEPGSLTALLGSFEGAGGIRLTPTLQGTFRVTLEGTWRVALERDLFERSVLGIAYLGKRGTGSVQVLGDRVFLFQR